MIHKVVIYERVGFILGGSPLESESLYTACLFLIALFLIAQIIVTFVYNYIIVHENLNGMIAMSVFLVLVLIYYLFAFGSFPMSKLESTCVCIASVFEIFGLIYLYVLVKEKKEYRHVQKYQKRLSVIMHYEPVGNSNEANRTRLGLITPPEITISYTENEINKPGDEEEIFESGLTTSQSDEEPYQSSEPEQEHENSLIEYKKSVYLKKQQQHHHENRKQTSRSKNSCRNVSGKSKSSFSLSKQESHHHRHHQRSNKHRSHDHLTVPDQFDNLEKSKEEEDESSESRDQIVERHLCQRVQSEQSSPVLGRRHRTRISRSAQERNVHQHYIQQQQHQQQMHRSAESLKETQIYKSSINYSEPQSDSHYQYHQEPSATVNYCQLPSTVYNYNTENYNVFRSSTDYSC